MAEEEKQYFPWPRELYVPIIEYMRRAGAKGVAFDVLFTEPSHSGVSDDIAFAEAMRGQMPVIAALATRGKGTFADTPVWKTFAKRQQEAAQQYPYLTFYTSALKPIEGAVTLPVPQILEHATAFGNVAGENDDDGVFRRIVPGYTVHGVPVLTLPFALFQAVEPNRVPDLSAMDGGTLALRFKGPARTYSTRSYISILRSFQQLEEGTEPLVPLSEFKDSYVLVGMDAPGLLDLRPTPISGTFPGVEVHATALDNILNPPFNRRASNVENFLFSILFSALAAGGIFFFSAIRRQVLWATLCLVALVVSCYVIAGYAMWIHMVNPIVCITYAILIAMTLQYQLEGAQARFIKRAFEYYVSPDMIGQIIADPTALSLGGEKRELSIFFCDIAGFTTISESMAPAELVHFLNTFLSEMTNIILASGGTVDKYVGDAIIAFWNAPLPLEDHALKAVHAAIACQKRLAVLRPDFLKRYNQDIYLRIGLHTGEVSVGNFGSSERFNYTIIGDAANLASRLEGANKAFGSDILFSESTFKALQGKVSCLRLGRLKVVGKDTPVEVYTTAESLSADEIQAFSEAVRIFETGDLEGAERKFSELSTFAPSKKYIARIQSELVSPTRPWDPTWKLTDK